MCILISHCVKYVFQHSETPQFIVDNRVNVSSLVFLFPLTPNEIIHNAAKQTDLMFAGRE